MAIGTEKKDPDATLDYSIDWSAWLDDDLISGSEWFPETGITVDTSTNTTTTATVWLSGGTAGETYTVTNRITTAGGRIDERSLIIECEER